MTLLRAWLLRPVVLCGAALLGQACDAERSGYRQAGLIHGRSIARIAAFAPFLRPPPDPARPGAAWRFGARVARLEILKQAAGVRERRPAPERESPPAARVAAALEKMVPACAGGAAEDGAEVRHAAACRAATLRASAALGREDAAATARGLPPRTIPPIAPTIIDDEGRQAAADLARRLRPPAAERERARLWADPEAEPAQLLLACDEALAAAGGGVPGAADEIDEACAPLREGERLLRQACGSAGAACSGLSDCGLLTSLSLRAELPPRFRERLRDAAARCRAAVTAPTDETPARRRRRRR